RTSACPSTFLRAAPTQGSGWMIRRPRPRILTPFSRKTRRCGWMSAANSYSIKDTAAASVAEDRPIVLKFGGTSVGSPERIRNVARIVQKHRELHSKVVVVVSAMGDTTDDLIALAEKVSLRALNPSHKREMDMLLSAGES